MTTVQKLNTLKLLGFCCVLEFFFILYLLSWCSSETEKLKHGLRSLPEKGVVMEKIYELDNKTETFHQLEKHVHDMERQLRLKYPEAGPIIKGHITYQIPWIYAITPTYARHVQKAELTRLAQTLINVKNFHWIVIEDSETQSELVANFLSRCGVHYTHLNALTPSDVKLKPDDPNWLKPRGVNQRNEGLKWIRDNLVNWKHDAVVYFMDDDNTYDLRLFEEMRYTKTVSVWPVGLVGGLLFERPLVNSAGHVIGWHSGWKPKTRPFAMDMAGFAINLIHVLGKNDALFSNDVRRGYQEGHIIEAVGVTMDQLEPKANNCTEVLVWHTRTEEPPLKMERKYRARGMGSSLDVEV